MERTELLDLMGENVLVLTASARLSRALLAEYESHRSAAGATAWATPALLPWQSWLKQCWEEALLTLPAGLPGLLNAHQARLLWKQVLAQQSRTGLLSENALIRQLQKSWRLLHEWRLDLHDPGFSDTADAVAFQALAQAFTRECKKRNCCTEAEMSSLLAERILAGSCRLPQEILLLGFSMITPAQEHLLDVLQQVSVRVRRVRLKGKQGQTALYSLPDPGQELTMAAIWARSLLLEQPDLSLGIVVPDLQNRYHQVTHCLNRVLEPESLLPGQRPSRSAWNLSLGRPLAEYEPVTAALDLLSLMRGKLSLERIEALLRSPFVAGRGDESLPRAWLVHRLRDTGQNRFGLGQLLHHARMRHGKSGEPRLWYCEKLGESLVAMADLRREIGSGSRTAAAWVEAFSRWLETAGWMAGVSLDSVDYQVVERWKRLLSDFRSLDRVVVRLPVAEALIELQRMAQEVMFQPRYPAAPLQVLGLFEATELSFDKLWVMGMHESAWPAAPSPDPFIPLAVQRARQMPGADPNRELELAREMLAGLETAAEEVLFSHALMEGAEELQPTPLLDHCTRADTEELELPQYAGWEKQVLLQSAMEHIQDQGLPVKQAVRGGSSLFRHQSQCPFRAFVEHRLGARPFPRTHTGLDAAQRGSLLHQALEIFWEQTLDQQRLLELDAAALRDRIQVSVSGALAELERHQPGLLGARARDIEARRLQGLMTGWMEKEKVRAPFRVQNREQGFEGRMHAVEYRLFIDRIDELQDGRQILIDYKTGRVSPSDWFGERPDDPQLPLYSTVLDPQRVAAVTFARLRPEMFAFAGVVAEEKLLPGLPPARGSEAIRQATANWPEVLDQWHRTLDDLAREFSDGRADVAPRDGLNTCTRSWCELMTLCRFHSLPEEGGEE
jgi:probable DNA repair protein